MKIRIPETPEGGERMRRREVGGERERDGDR